MPELTKTIDEAIEKIIAVYEESKSTDVQDILAMMEEHREHYIQENSQFGVGA